MLRAARYLPLCRKGIADVVADAPNWTYKGACSIYAEDVPTWSDPEIALLGANDRFFLLTELLHRKDACHPWLYERCRMVEAAPDGFLDLWARYHYKSTIGTFAGIIQEIIVDPEMTVAIFSATQKLARSFLAQIKTELETNERLKTLYADVLWKNPKREAMVWALDRGICVKREGSMKEQTVEAFGFVEGLPSGPHFKLLNYDDIITRAEVTNVDIVHKINENWELSTNLGIGEGTKRWHWGTRYTFADTYGVLLERGVLTPRVFPATAKPDGSPGGLDDKPVFFSQEHWEQVKRDQRSTCAAQMLQNPLAGKEATFDPRTLRSYQLRPRTLNVYIMGDPSQGIKAKTSDRTAIVAIGVDQNGNKYLLDGYCHRMKLSERWENLRNLYKRWDGRMGVQSVQVGWERYGMQADCQYFEERMEEKDEPKFSIEELNWTREGDQSKKSRVQRLEPDFNRNAFYLPAKVWNPNAHWKDQDGKEQSGPRTCLWSVEGDSGKIEYRPIPRDPKRGNIPMETKIEIGAKRSGEAYRIIEAIRRRDEEKNVYDLTRIFFEEMMFFPFTPHDDLIDAASRIYDMNPTTPMIIERELLETPVYID